MPSNPKVHFSSYTNGGVFEQTTSHRTLGDMLSALSINAGEATIEVTGEDGEERNMTAAGVFREGDTVMIMKRKNRSGV